MKKSRIGMLVFLMVFAIAVSPAYAANTVNVNSTMNNTAIQDAIDAAADGDFINFLAGTYDNISLSINKAALNLIGNGAILNGNNSVISIIGAATAGTNVTGFVINGDGNNYGITVRNTSNVNVENNSINNTKNAIYFENVNNSSIKSNTITNNTKKGIDVENSAGLTSFSNLNGLNNILIDKNTLLNTKSAITINAVGFTISNNYINQFSSHGIDGGRDYSFLVENNTLLNGGDAINFFGYIINSSIVGNNINNMSDMLGGHGDGISVINHENTTVLSTIINNNVNNTYYGIWQGGFQGTISGNTIDNSLNASVNLTAKSCGEGCNNLNANVTNNTINNAPIGISIEQDVKDVNITNNNINNTTYGVSAVNKSNIHVENNKISNTKNAVYFNQVNKSSVKSNNITNSTGYGVNVDDNGSLSSYNNEFSNNTFTNTKGTYHLHAPTSSANQVSGNYYAPVTVSLSSQTGASPATIYYTTDGSTPTTKSNVYTGSLKLTTSHTVKYFSQDSLGNSSSVATQKYNIYKKVTSTKTVKVAYKKGWYKSYYNKYYKHWYKKWYKSHGKWKVKWKYTWKHKLVYKWKYGWLYHNVQQKTTKWALT